MVSKKNNVIVATVLAIFSFVAVIYMSCNKPGKDNTKCKNVVCRNGGHCNDSSDCVCPVGYEDTVCGTETVAKYISNWGVKQTIMYSDSIGYKGTDSFYTVALARTATPTTFFITKFNNNDYYSNIVCTLDSINSNHFRIDTISAYQMIYFSYQILSGQGELNATRDTITANYVTRYRNHTSNWQVDSVRLIMAKHDY
ncbi:MAG: hypothetical protein JWQ38_2428 [Flavipsychrobacter sp.]|nr:hypothetical protein [Flavipsychrobacter sp.]